MTAASTYLENKLLDHSLATTTFTKPTAVYAALFTGDPGEAGSFTNEVAASIGYARILVTFGAAVNGSASNNININFPQATANWGAVTHIALCDTLTRATGNVLYKGALNPSRTIVSGEAFQITIGNLIVTLE